MTRLVAVLGYSDSTTSGIPPDRRSAVRSRGVGGQRPTTSSCSRVGHEAFSRPQRPTSRRELDRLHRARLVDRRARTTLGNAIGIARGAPDRRRRVVLVTSRWHAHRAATLLRASLLGSATRLRIVASDEPVKACHGVREAASRARRPVLARRRAHQVGSRRCDEDRRLGGSGWLALVVAGCGGSDEEDDPTAAWAVTSVPP